MFQYHSKTNKLSGFLLFFSLIFLLFFSNFLSAQTEQSDYLDSLKHYNKKEQYETAKYYLDKIDETQFDDEKRILFLLEKGNYYLRLDRQGKADTAFSDAFNYAIKTDNSNYQAQALYLTGFKYFSKSVYDSAHVYFERALDLRNEIDPLKTPNYVVAACNGLGVIAKYKGDNRESIKWYLEGLREDKKSGNKQYSYFLINLMNVYLVERDYINAAKYALKNIERAEETGEEAPKALGYLTLGEIYQKQDKPAAALSMMDTALVYWCKDLDYFEAQYSSTIGQMGTCFLQMGNYNKAYDYLEQDSTFLASIENRENFKINSHLDLCTYYLRINQPKIAFGQLERAGAYLSDFEFNNLRSRMHEGYAEYYKSVGMRDSSIVHYQQVIESSEHLDFKAKSKANLSLAELYQESGQLKKALPFALAAKAYADSLNYSLNTVEVPTLLLGYEKEKRELLFAAETERKQREVQYQASQKRLLIFLFGCALAIVLLLINRYRQTLKFSEKLESEVEKKTKQLADNNKQLEKSQTELRNFYAVMAHDFRYPILNVQSGLKKLIPKAQTEEAEKLLRKGSRTLQNMYDSFERILGFFRQESDPVNKQVTDLSALCKDLINTEMQLQRFSRLQIKFENLPTLSGDTMLLRQVFLNLMANAADYTAEEDMPLLKITSRPEGNNHVLLFNDNGKGIDPSIKRKLFQSFVTGNTKDESHIGIGLFFIKRIVERHGGSISLSEQKNDLKGAAFEIRLPI